MSTKKTLLVLVLTCLLCAGLIFYYFYSKYYRDSKLPEYIPSEAESVIYINAKMVYERFFEKRDSTVRFRTLRSNPYFESVRDVRETGIDLLSDAACVQYREIYYGLLVLDDAGEFEQTLGKVSKDLLGLVQNCDGFSKVLAIRDSFVLAWNKQRLVFIPRSKKQVNDAYIKEILEVRSKDNFSSRGTFAQAKKDDALIWFYARKAEPRIAAPLSLKGYLTWDTAVHLFATDDLSAPYPSRQVQFPDIPLNSVYTDTGNSFVNKGLQALSLAYLPLQLEQLKGMDLSHYNKAFIRKGKQEIRNEVISYAYDDNFNKQKIVSVKVDTVDVAALYLFSPGGKAGKVITNGTDTSAKPGFQLPGQIKLAANFNQDLPGILYPVPLKYHVRFLQEYKNGHHQFWLSIKPGEWQKLLGM